MLANPEQKFMLEAEIAGVWTKVTECETVRHGARASTPPIGTRSFASSWNVHLAHPLWPRSSFTILN
jgi:hypothetical protein